MGIGLHDTIGDAQTVARQHVVRQRVAGDAGGEAEDREAVKPTTQLISRGLRNAPVKNTRIMCVTIAAVNRAPPSGGSVRIEHPAADLES